MALLKGVHLLNVNILFCTNILTLKYSIKRLTNTCSYIRDWLISCSPWCRCSFCFHFILYQAKGSKQVKIKNILPITFQDVNDIMNEWGGNSCPDTWHLYYSEATHWKVFCETKLLIENKLSIQAYLLYKWNWWVWSILLFSNIHLLIEKHNVLAADLADLMPSVWEQR